MKREQFSWKIAAAALLLTATCHGQYFGRVVAIGGHSSDLALDEARGVAYVANFTANRIDIVSLATMKVTKSMNVASQPSSLSLSPDGRHLVVAHFGNYESPNTPRNALTVVDLSNNGRQTFALADPPLGVAFGADGRALVVTTAQFILFDPYGGTMLVLDTIAGVTAKTLPQPPANYPAEIVAASVAASGDRNLIAGVSDTILFSYDVARRVVISMGYVADPPLGPRTVSVTAEGDRWLAGWGVFDNRGLLAQFADPSGELEIGSHAIDSARNTIYAQVTKREDSENTIPQLQVVDADNLRVRERLKLKENLSGKGVLSADGATMYALSESGLTILPVGSLDSLARVKASKEDVVFRGSGCSPTVVTQQVEITNPGGGSTPFKLKASASGIRLSQTSGTTPATIQISVDPDSFQDTRGTTVASIDITSTTAVNVIQPVRVLINLQDPDQRGSSVNVPGRLVDLLADPQRNRFFVLRQDANEVLVFDGGSYQQVATLRTGNTPTSMAFTFDRRYLMIGNDNSQYANVYDLETLDATEPIRFPFGHYPRWLAASGNAILSATRVAGPIHKIDQVDFFSRTATELPSLGVYENDIDLNTALVASANGSSIMAAQADGNLLLYNSSADTFTISRQDTEALSGAVAASNYDLFVVGGTLYNSSLVPTAQFDSTIETTSGFVFIDQYGYRTGTQSGGGTGVIQKVDLTTGGGQKSTRMAEAPVAGDESAAFTRSAAVLASRSAIVNLTTSGFTVLPWSYDASVSMPEIESVVNAADGTEAVAPGGLIVVKGYNLTPTNAASQEMLLQTALGESCLAVNGLNVPMLMVSSTQINAQLPFQAEGNVTMVLRTPGGVSDNFNITVLPNAPSVFVKELAADYAVPLVVRASNGAVVTPANPLRWEEEAIIYLTGMGQTYPEATAGQPAPNDPPAVPLTPPTVTLAGRQLPIIHSVLTPGQIGVNEIRVYIPRNTPKGMSQALTVEQGGFSTTVPVRVVQ
jgi:uncharacterized protein (TIGR03437 family)